MGKIFSRFKFLGSSTSRNLSKRKATYGVESDESTSTNTKNNNSVMNMSAAKLHEVNNFEEFDNILNVTCSPHLSTCMFGLADYVRKLFIYFFRKQK